MVEGADFEDKRTRFLEAYQNSLAESPAKRQRLSNDVRDGAGIPEDIDRRVLRSESRRKKKKTTKNAKEEEQEKDDLSDEGTPFSRVYSQQLSMSVPPASSDFELFQVPTSKTRGLSPRQKASKKSPSFSPSSPNTGFFSHQNNANQRTPFATSGLVGGSNQYTPIQPPLLFYPPFPASYPQTFPSPQLPPNAMYPPYNPSMTQNLMSSFYPAYNLRLNPGAGMPFSPPPSPFHQQLQQGYNIPQATPFSLPHPPNLPSSSLPSSSFPNPPFQREPDASILAHMRDSRLLPSASNIRPSMDGNTPSNEPMPSSWTHPSHQPYKSSINETKEEAKGRDREITQRGSNDDDDEKNKQP